jgi:Domain of unknown function (DU1801)
MADLKTKQTNEDVLQFLNGIPNEQRRKDSLVILNMMREVTGIEPVFWVGNIIGFGKYHYKYASGHEGDACMMGFSPRKQNLALYVLSGFKNQQALLKKLGKHKAGVGCLYVNKLDDVHLPTLRKIVEESFKQIKKRTG